MEDLVFPVGPDIVSAVIMVTKILYVCSVPALESYSAGVISTAFSNKKIEVYAYVFLKGTDRRTKTDLLNQYGIPEEKKLNVIFVYLDSNKLIRMLSAGRYLSKIVNFANGNDLKIIHFISQDVMVAGHLPKFAGFRVFYTVHDLVPHEVRLNLLQRLKHYYFRIRKDKMLIQGVPNLVTNSLKQMEQLKQLFPQKNIGFHQMPDLVTYGVRSGIKKLEELSGIEKYVLFFGKIELYKGVEQLYKTFIDNILLKDQMLVIAGSGNIYFKRQPNKEKNIIILNKFIEEQEINYLFSKACMLVLPYLSATQSAVTSLAYHYHLPVVSSDIEGLKETVVQEQTGLIYNSGEPQALGLSILRLLNDQRLSSEIAVNLKNKSYFYNQNELWKQMVNLYKE